MLLDRLSDPSVQDGNRGIAILDRQGTSRAEVPLNIDDDQRVPWA
jgi:hypothetical protein